ncbi:MAG TPA: helix-turn-helix transcriptional regulator [Ktedonobacteraceae bacterium]|nr:helix-turn-helix transcriptional regulator [Ktedonobacteraceae bacterium]
MQHIPSFAGQFLKNYRNAHKLTQEQLAVELKIEPRTLRAYENGERQLNNINELRRISEILNIEPELLGVAAPIYVPKSPEEIDAVVKRTWTLLDEVKVSEARVLIEKLIRNTSEQITTEDPKLLKSLARALHAAGYVTGLGTRLKEIAIPIHYYHELEDIARLIKDDTLLSIALTYQGDMLRRSGDITNAIVYLEAARDTAPKADTSARGNALQLLGRTYLPAKNKRGFERAIGEAEELAYQINPLTDSTRGQYNPLAIYEEYGKSYGILGQPQKALDFLERAEKARPKNKFWAPLLDIAKAEVLIYNGQVDEGLPLAVRAAEVCQQQGHLRRLERIYCMRRFLSRKAIEYAKAEAELGDRLDGLIEGWDKIE